MAGCYLKYRRNRNRQYSVLAVHMPLSFPNIRSNNSVYVKLLHACRSRHNIHNRVHGPHLMKMNFICRTSVNLSFRFRHNPEHLLGQLQYSGLQACPIQHLFNISPSPMGMCMGTMSMVMFFSMLMMMRMFMMHMSPFLFFQNHVKITGIQPGFLYSSNPYLIAVQG